MTLSNRHTTEIANSPVPGWDSDLDRGLTLQLQWMAVRTFLDIGSYLQNLDEIQLQRFNVLQQRFAAATEPEKKEIVQEVTKLLLGLE